MANGPARLFGLILSLTFFVFSVVMFFKTWDWVAAVFALGSLGYALFFILSYQRNKS
jgi:CHASE2 domain-containing sensor protein